MPTLSKIEEITLQVMQDFPNIAARYAAGDPTIVAPLKSMMHTLAEVSRDVDISELEPFIKTRDATILADASNKGILPLCTPCQHYIEVKNNGNSNLSLQSNRSLLDGLGRPWRLLQSVNAAPGETATVLVEQSEIRTVEYTPETTETFHNYALDLKEETDLVQLSVKDQDNNIYNFVTRWMNTKAGDLAITLKTNTKRKIILEFGDSDRFGTTLLAGTQLKISITESFGKIDVSQLREASLETVTSSIEQRATIKFKSDGLVRTGADPLSIEQLRLLSSFPTDEDNAVYLGNYNYAVLKKFLTRSNYINVWNEVVQEQNYGASYLNINKMFVSVLAESPADQALLETDILNYIPQLNNLYKGKIIFKPVQERPFKIFIKGLLSPVHDINAVKEEIRTLLLKYYGRGKTASCYYLANGFNAQEISKLLSDNISAFQDRSSDFKFMTEDLDANPVKPHQWLYMTAESIELDIVQLKGNGESRWSII
ncbi:hypothetical protein ACT426_18525 (plasmid) [Acinetobacter baumannii]